MNVAETKNNPRTTEPQAEQDQGVEKQEDTVLSAAEEAVLEGGEASSDTEETVGTDVTVSSEEWEEVKRQADENYQRYLRTQADFDNFRRRSRLERDELTQYAAAKLVEALLPTLDNLERALSSSKASADFDSLIKGIDMVYRQLEHTLTQEGLQAISAVDQPFDPELHQAVMQEAAEGKESGIVLAELQKGYKYKEKVLRPAMVKVSE
jgi:molecular chaperone GrpE